MEDTAISSNVSFGYFEVDSSMLLGNASAYNDSNGVVADSEWALQVAGSSYGWIPQDVTFPNDVAILASNFDFLSLPTNYYKEIEALLTRNNFTCEAEYPSEDVICGTLS